MHSAGHQLTLHQRERAARSIHLIETLEAGQARESAGERRNHAATIVGVPA
jgi:hypothetical protein